MPVPDDEGAVLGGQQAYDVALTAIAVFVAGLTVLFVLAAFAPPAIGRYFEPVTRLFVVGMFGFRVWQLAAVALLAVVTWLLVLDIRSD